MEVRLAPSWELSTEHPSSSYGIPVLVNSESQEAFGPGDIVQLYPSHNFAPASIAVRRLAKTARLDEEGEALVSQFVDN